MGRNRGNYKNDMEIGGIKMKIIRDKTEYNIETKDCIDEITVFQEGVSQENIRLVSEVFKNEKILEER